MIRYLAITQIPMKTINLAHIELPVRLPKSLTCSFLKKDTFVDMEKKLSPSFERSNVDISKISQQNLEKHIKIEIILAR